MTANKLTTKIFNLKLKSFSPARSGKKLLIMAVIIAAAVFLSLFVFSWGDHNPTSRIIDGVTADTAYYLEIPAATALIWRDETVLLPAKNDWWRAWLKKHFLPYLSSLGLEKTDFNLLAGKGVQRAGLIYNKNDEAAVILEFAHENQVAKILASNLTRFTNVITDKNIVVIASSSGWLETLAAQFRNPQNTNPKNLSLQSRLKKFAQPDSAVFIYYEPTFWAKLISEEKILNALDLAEYEKYLTTINKPIFINISDQAEKMVIDIDSTQLWNLPFKPEHQIDTGQIKLVNQLQRSGWIFFVGFNPWQYLQGMTAKEKESQLNEYWKKQMALWAKKFSFTAGSLENFLNQNFTLAVPAKQVGSLVRGDFDILATPYLLIYKLDPNNHFFQNLLTNIVAFKFPQERVITLPDKSKATELVASLDDVGFSATSTLEFNGQLVTGWAQNSLNLLAKNDVSLGYFSQDNNLFFSSSPEMLATATKIFTGQPSNKEQNTTDCLPNDNTALYVGNPGAFFISLAPFRSATLTSQEKEGYLNLRLCLEWL